jgi:DNA repair photolyase
MAINKSKGNMYEFVTHTWNTVKGECPHRCGYCYMRAMARRFNKPLCQTYFDVSELKTNLGQGNFIFIGSSNDLFAKDIPEEWIRKTLKHCENFNSKYLFQTKNPTRILDYIDTCVISDKSIICTTIETNRYYRNIMRGCPIVNDRIGAMSIISEVVKTFVTIEPVMDFDLPEFTELIKKANPVQVNIGADTGHNELPEPPKEKLLELIAELEKFTKVIQKSNLKRLIKHTELIS